MRVYDVKVGDAAFFAGFPAVVVAVADETCNVVVTLDGPASARSLNTGSDPRVSVHGTHAWVQDVRESELAWPDVEETA